MNFLLHRHLALRHLGSEAAGLGAMIPDLWRMADRRMRARRAAAEPDPENPLVRDLAVGVAHHLWADEWFHRHPSFVEGEAATRAELSASGAEADRLGLLAHVAWELCLDGALVRRSGAEPLIADVRRGIELCRGEALEHLRRLHRPPFRDDPSRTSRLDRRLEGLLDELAEGHWIAGYAHGAGLVDRLGGVRRRIGLEPFSKADRERLVGVAAGLLDRAEAALGPLEQRTSEDFLPPETRRASRSEAGWTEDGSERV